MKFLKESATRKYGCLSTGPIGNAEKKKCFPCLFLCFKLVTPGQGQFQPQGHHKNKLGRGQLADATYQISKLYFFLFQRRKILKFSFFVPMFQTCDPPGQASFDPRSIIWTILVEVH